jgi:hypothetical protein
MDQIGRDLIASVWKDLQAVSRERELDAIKADPEKHRMTRIMAAGASTNYTYWPASVRRVSKKREDRIRFCVSKGRNAAGFFLLWRQVDRYKLVKGRWKWFETERFFSCADTRKKELRRVAGVRAERDKAEWAGKSAAKLAPAPAEVRMTVDAAIRSLATE